MQTAEHTDSHLILPTVQLRDVRKIRRHAGPWIEQVECRIYALIYWAVAAFVLSLVRLDLVAMGVVAITTVVVLYALTIGFTVRLAESAFGSALHSKRVRVTVASIALTVGAFYLARSTYSADHSGHHAGVVVGVFFLGVVVHYRRRQLVPLVRAQIAANVGAGRARVSVVLQLCRKRHGRAIMSGNKPAVVTGPHTGGGWQNKVEGNQRASNVSPTKAEAQAIGRAMAQRFETEHKIQNQHGQITERNSYGNDPRSRKG